MLLNEQALLEELLSIEGNGSFTTTGVKNFVQPGLYIADIGDVGFPLSKVQAQELIAYAKQAPYGKGLKTLTDTTVRSTWEIDAKKVAFQNEAWKPFLKEVIKEVKNGLGLNNTKIKPKLYKLLIYQTGDFFLPHKDSEKEKGMFGTLVISLPSEHTGGELEVEFGGVKNTIDFSKIANKFQIAFTAFYADCTHEIKPITSGYRLALVYNLLLDANSEKQLGSPNFNEQVTHMTNILKTMETDGDAKFPKVILLGHQYTPANFSDQTLKLHDKPRYQAMLEAAKNAGYYTALGLVTHYLMGALEVHYSSRKRRYGYYDDDEDLENGEMGEVYEEYMTIEHWGKSEFPELGDLDVKKEDIITDIAFDESEEPIEKEAEGYTGNAGMTMEYWYHYGAVVFWPKSKHADVLLGEGYHVWLEWLDHYTTHLNKDEPQAEEYCIKLLENLSNSTIETYRSHGLNCNAIAQALLMLNQQQLFTQTMQEHLVQIFPFISSGNWAKLAAQFNPDITGTVFDKIADQNDIVFTKHIIEVLFFLMTDASIMPKPHHFIAQQVALLPQRLEHSKPFALQDDRHIYAPTGRLRKEAIATIIKLLLDINLFVNNNPIWEDDLVAIFTQNMQRTYVNEVLIPQLINYKGVKGGLYAKLYSHALQDIQTRAADKPMPPPDWSREVPKTKTYAHIWEMLRSFLQSPTETVFDYIKAESYRREMESAISQVTIDLKMETIRKGSPHTLRLTKTQTAYDRLVQEWKDDVKLLAKLEEVNK